MVLKEGDEAPGFCIIMEGEATVLLSDEAGAEHESVTLRRGDYWGGRALQKTFISDYSLIASSEEKLVALVLTRADLDKLGYVGKKQLRVPRRPAMFEGRWQDRRPREGRGNAEQGDGKCSRRGAPVSDFEVEWIIARMKESPHLRGLVAADEADVRRVATTAVCYDVSAGQVVAQGGEHGDKFFIVVEGNFEMTPRMLTKAGHRRSAEKVVACERLHRQKVIKDYVWTKLVGSEPEAEHGKISSSRTVRFGAARYFSASSIGSTSSKSLTGAVVGLDRRRRRLQTDMVGIQPKVQQRLLGSGQKLKRVGSRTGLDVGSAVQCVDGLGLPQGIGTVLNVPEDIHGEAEVEFPAPIGVMSIPADHLVPASHTLKPRALGPGDTFGELATMYDMPYLGTFKALDGGKVFAIARSEMRSLRGDNEKVKEYAKLLQEVVLLTPMLQNERLELARVAEGLYSFEPDEMIMRQGQTIEDPMWYIVAGGSCRVYTRNIDGERKCLGDIFRGQHFGERCILRGDLSSEFDIIAGSGGLTALAISGNIVRRLGCLKSDPDSAGTPGGGCSPGIFPAVPRLDMDASSYFEEIQKAQECGACGQAQQMRIPPRSLRPVAKLGEGGFGAVFLVESCNTHQTYALKRLSLQHIKEHDIMAQTKSERDLMSLMDSCFLIRFFEAFMDERYIYLLMEAAPGGHLWDLLCEHPELFKDERSQAARFYIACTTMGCGYLHNRHIAHRDVKLENVLLGSNGYAKLCDFGFARYVLGTTRTLLGTPNYMSPELIEAPHKHDLTVDWWALGVMSFELFASTSPWDVDEDDENPWAHLMAVHECQKQGPPLNAIGKGRVEPKDFVRRLLVCNPKKRLGAGGAEEVRKHRLFEQLDFEALRSNLIEAPFRPKCDLEEFDRGELEEALEGEGLFPGISNSNDGASVVNSSTASLASLARFREGFEPF